MFFNTLILEFIPVYVFDFCEVRESHERKKASSTKVRPWIITLETNFLPSRCTQLSIDILIALKAEVKEATKYFFMFMIRPIITLNKLGFEFIVALKFMVC